MRSGVSAAEVCMEVPDFSHTAKQIDKERNAQIDKNAVEDGYRHDLLARAPRDGRQQNVHRVHSRRRDGSQLSEVAAYERSTHKRHHLAYDVAEQRYRSKLGGELNTYRRFLELRYQYGRQRVIGEAAAHCHAVEHAPPAEQQTCRSREKQRARDGGKRHKQYLRTDMSQTFAQTLVAADANAHLQHEHIEYAERHVVHVGFYFTAHTGDTTGNENRYYEQTIFHFSPLLS